MTAIAQNYLINGSKGPYSTNTQVGRSANAGNEVANLFKTGKEWKLKSTDIIYSNMNGGYDNTDVKYFKTPDPKLSIKSGLAYSTAALKGYDENGDGVVTVNEFNASILSKNVKPGMSIMRDPNYSPKFGQTVDLNGDGKIDTGEFTAWTIYQDGMNTANNDGSYNAASSLYSRDGKVTANEAGLAEQQINKDANVVKAELQQIYSNNNIANAQRNFTMPPKKPQTPTTPTFPQNNFMQMLMRLMQMLMTGFGFCGFGGQQTV